MKYFIFTIYSDYNIFKSNLLKSFSIIKKTYTYRVYLFSTDNQRGKYLKAREWLNSVLEYIKKHSDKFRNSWLVISHQDVYLPESFFYELDKHIESIPNDVGLIGFSGVDHYNKRYNLFLDSGMMICSGNYRPQKVDSVDDFLFCLNSEVIIKNDIRLSLIDGWHAYSPELSILLRRVSYKTYYIPVYVEHNSQRKNNKGLFSTHLKLYNIYGETLMTTCGMIGKYSSLKKFHRIIYELYSCYGKYGAFSKEIMSIKYAIYRTIKCHRYIYIKSFFRRGDRLLYLIVASGSTLSEEKRTISSSSGNIEIRFFENQIDLEKYISSSYNKNAYSIINVLGLKKRIQGFKYFSRINLNYLDN